jgi:hypothetical protein
MPVCEQDIIDVPLSASLPGSLDMVLFTLPDGTSVLRRWSTIITGLVPDDEEYTVVASGTSTNAIINGDNTFVLTNFIGRRVRLIRGGIPQSTIVGTFYYSFDTALGEFTVVPAPSTGEKFIIQAY